MRAPDYRDSFLRRISIRRNQVISMDVPHEQELQDLSLFQNNVSDRFSDLLFPSGDTPTDPLLSIAWLRKLLDVFLCCEAQFKSILIMTGDPSQISKPPLDRLIPEFLDRSVKALDICNAVVHGIESVRHYQKLAEIAVSALEQSPVSDGQVKRARKALNSLLTSLAAEDKETRNIPRFTERAWSFGRRGVSSVGVSGGGHTVQKPDRGSRHFRSISSSCMAKGWSAAKQIQAISTNLVPPRGGESSGLAQRVYVMSVITVFVMWTLVAAVPCQERNGLGIHFLVPRHFEWAQSMIGLQEKIAEEWKRKEMKGSSDGLMEELQKLEKFGQDLIEFADGFEFPTERERLEEVREMVAELKENCSKMEEGLGGLQRQIREVFHRVARSRTEVLHAFEQSRERGRAGRVKYMGYFN